MRLIIKEHYGQLHRKPTQDDMSSLSTFSLSLLVTCQRQGEVIPGHLWVISGHVCAVIVFPCLDHRTYLHPRRTLLLETITKSYLSFMGILLFRTISRWHPMDARRSRLNNCCGQRWSHSQHEAHRNTLTDGGVAS